MFLCCGYNADAIIELLPKRHHIHSVRCVCLTPVLQRFQLTIQPSPALADNGLSATSMRCPRPVPSHEIVSLHTVPWSAILGGRPSAGTRVVWMKVRPAMKPSGMQGVASTRLIPTCATTPAPSAVKKAGGPSQCGPALAARLLKEVDQQRPHRGISSTTRTHPRGAVGP